MWDSLADINAIDRERGLFGVKDAEAAPVTGGDAATVDRLVAAMLEAAAVADGSVERSPELLQKAGSLLKRLVAGLLVMVEARARAKAQMGAEMTGLQLEGNNPIKFARSPEQALAQLLMPPQDGFMDADKAVEDAYLDLQSHQVATLARHSGRAALDARPLLARLDPPPRREYRPARPHPAGRARRRSVAQLRARVRGGEEGIRRGLHGGLLEGIPKGL